MAFPRILLGLILVALTVPVARAQHNVRAWQADGQVWVLWQFDTNAAPQTFAVWRATDPFSHTTNAMLRGRLFPPEWSGETLRLQSAAAFGTHVLAGYRVPDGQGGQYELGPDEGLFVDTVRDSGQGHYAVTPAGQVEVLPAQHTPAPVSYTLRHDQPPRLHLQLRAPTPHGHLASCYMMWADGDQDEHAGRIDFPIMGNAAKRGAPHLCWLIGSTNAPGATPAPATLLLHSDDREAAMWIPDPDSPTRSIGIDPGEGLLIAPDDKLHRLLNGAPSHGGTRWFGWAREYDPFRDVTYTNGLPIAPSMLPHDADVVVHYTQRRLLWLLDRLAAEGVVDPERVSLMGHGAGAMGALALAKAHPHHFASVTLFNAGLRAPATGESATLMGTPGQNLATTLHRRDVRLPGVPMTELWSLNDPLSPFRDPPLVRLYNGKADPHPESSWDTALVGQFRLADRLGWGMHLHWDQRGHAMEDWDDFWVRQSQLELQTRRDDVAAQARYRTRQSFPAFCNLQDHPGHGDPGTGQPGMGDGDHHGTWGGLFDWDTDTLLDQPRRWECTLFLTGLSESPVDNAPVAALTADVALRKPRAFRPVPGRLLDWRVERLADGALLQGGVVMAESNWLVTLPSVTVRRDPDRVRLIVEDLQPTHYDRLLLTDPMRGQGQRFRFDVVNEPLQAPFVAEFTTNHTDWAELETVLPKQSPHRVRDSGAIGQPRRFYRVRRGGFVTDTVPAAPGLHPLRYAGPRHQRHYVLYRPASYSAATPAPLCLVLHGAGQTAAQFAFARAELHSLAESSGMIVAYPEGIMSAIDPAPHWITQETPWEDNAPDDLAFVLGLIDHLRQDLSIDPDRLYAAGFAEGGRMVHLLAGRTEGIFAAYATVACAAGVQETPGGPLVLPAAPAHPINLLAIAGNLDASVPFHGGPNDRDLFVEPQADLVRRFLRAHDCAGPAEVLALPNGDGRVETHTACAANSELVFVTLQRMTHDWPDEADGLGFSANQALMEFFGRH